MTEVSLPLVLISGIVALGLFIFLYYKGKNKRAHILSGFCFSLSVYSLAYFFAAISTNPSTAFFLDKISIIGAVFSVSLFMNFTIIYTEQKKNYLIEISYFASIVLTLMAIGNIIISSVSIKPFHEELGQGYFAFMLQLIFTYILCTYYLVTYFNKASASERTRTIYMLFFFSILSLAAAIDMLRLAEIIVFIDVLLLQYAIFLFIIGITYTILKYRLLKIRVIIHKSAKYTLIATIVLLIFELFKIVLDELFSDILSISYSSKVSIILLTFLFEPIKQKTEKFCDRLFLKKKN